MRHTIVTIDIRDILLPSMRSALHIANDTDNSSRLSLSNAVRATIRPAITIHLIFSYIFFVELIIDECETVHRVIEFNGECNVLQARSVAHDLLSDCVFDPKTASNTRNVFHALKPNIGHNRLISNSESYIYV